MHNSTSSRRSLPTTGCRIFYSLVVLLLLAGSLAHAQAPSWQQVLTSTTSAGGAYAEITATASAPDGNMYVAGSFSQTATFGNTTLTSAGGRDIFVAKWEKATNSFSWAQRAGGIYNDDATAIASNGTSFYVVGIYGEMSIALGGITLSSSHEIDNIFITKVSDTGSAGRFVWAKNAAVGNGSAPSVNAVAVAGDNVYLAGDFTGATASFGSITVTKTTVNGFRESYVAKLQDTGNDASFVWVQNAGGTDASVYGLAVNGSAVYVAGAFKGTNMKLGSLALASAGDGDAFVAKIEDAGMSSRYVWAQRAGGTRSDGAMALVVVGNALYAAGAFSSATADFGSTVLTNPTTREAQIFVAKLTDGSTASNVEWVLQAGGTLNSYANALAVQGTNLYVAGNFSGSSAKFGTTTLTNSGVSSYGDIYVAKITNTNSTPSFAWAQSAGGGAGESAYSLALSGSEICVTGVVVAPASFGSFPVTTAGGNAARAFVATLTDPLLLTSKKAAPPVDMHLYPNPAQARVTLQVAAQPGTGSASLALLDALGRSIRTYSLTVPTAGLRHELDLTGLPAGLYAVRVQVGASQSVRWLTVE